MKARGAAVFDLDGTITRSDTYAAFLRLGLSRPEGRLGRCARAAAAFLGGGFGFGRAGAKQAALAAAFGGATREEMDRLVAPFVAYCLDRLVKPQARERIARHLGEGSVLVLATAGLDVYAEPLGAQLGFHRVLASRAAWSAQGRLTGHLAAGNLRGAAKAAAVATLLQDIAAPDATVVAYSDHQADLPLLTQADHGIAVDPTRQLAKAASALGLAVEHWG